MTSTSEQIKIVTELNSERFWGRLETVRADVNYGILSIVEVVGVRMLRIQIYATGDMSPRQSRIVAPKAIMHLCRSEEQTCRYNSNLVATSETNDELEDDPFPPPSTSDVVLMGGFES